MGRANPESAWTWALSIGGGNRMSALQSAYSNLRRKDPNIAQEMLQSANLSPDEVKAVQSVPQQISGGVFYAPF
jgi:hypothetical protein